MLKIAALNFTIVLPILAITIIYFFCQSVTGNVENKQVYLKNIPSNAKLTGVLFVFGQILNETLHLKPQKHVKYL